MTAITQVETYTNQFCNSARTSTKLRKTIAKRILHSQTICKNIRMGEKSHVSYLSLTYHIPNM